MVSSLEIYSRRALEPQQCTVEWVGTSKRDEEEIGRDSAYMVGMVRGIARAFKVVQLQGSWAKARNRNKILRITCCHDASEYSIYLERSRMS